MGRIEQKLKELGIVLPPPPKVPGRYFPWMRSGNLLFIPSQFPWQEGKIVFKGKVPTQINEEQAKEALKLCLFNALSVIKSAIGELDEIRKFLKLKVLVNCEPDFENLIEITDPTSQLLLDIFGKAGEHIISVQGALSLPFGACTSLDILLEVV